MQKNNVTSHTKWGYFSASLCAIYFAIIVSFIIFLTITAWLVLLGATENYMLTISCQEKELWTSKRV